MSKKELDSEVNLVAFISLLSVLICSLLLTAIWVQIGTMDVKQAVGGQASEQKKPDPTLWVTVNKQQTLSFKLEDAPRKVVRFANIRIKSVEGKIDYTSVEGHLSKIKERLPNVRAALIKPSATTLYDDIIQLMDSAKKSGFIDLGVSPL